jgi:glutathione synthase/RimK-type ligase-like ATP-grasp enzyme
MKLMKRLGLVYGAIDMRKNVRGEYIFLEINTAGQWLFMEEPTGMPISETLADKLIEMDERPAQEPVNSIENEPDEEAMCAAL